VLVAALVAVGLLGARDELRPYYRFAQRYYADVPDLLARYPTGEPVAVVAPHGSQTVEVLHRMQWFQPDRPVVVIGHLSGEPPPGVRVVIARADWSGAKNLDADQVATTQVGGLPPQAVFVLPRPGRGAR